ncbi:hypothetical protein, partial [Amycolatopsis sp.]|uniref:hypothetical protein n=1 Tax=Amycolatopsis sp. TaxID=37632 RepID=UPI002DFF88C4|nr:hypothetical protein [Amycolatopsis sp.]
MRRLSRTALAILVVAACAAPVAGGAQDRHGPRGGPLVAPAQGGGMTGGELLGEAWVRGLSLPAENPFSGRCITLVDKVLAPQIGEDGTATCSASPGSKLLVFFGSFCTNYEAPLFPQTEAEQLACAIAGDQAIHEINITVDGGETINIVQPRFEVSSPQRTVQLPPDNVLGAPAGPATVTAHAWAAVIRKLRPGQHTIAEEVAADFGTGEERFTLTTFLNIVPRGHSHGEQDDDQ